MTNFTNRLIVVLALIIFSLSVAADNLPDTETLLQDLEQTIEQCEKIVASRERQIASVGNKLKITNPSPIQRFRLLGQLQTLYERFNCDSSMNIAQQRLDIAKQIDDSSYTEIVGLDIAETFYVAGMLNSSITTLSKINRRQLPDSLQSKYFNIYCKIYRAMSAMNIFEKAKLSYEKTADAFRDSLLRIYNNQPYETALILADRFIADKNGKKALQQIKPFVELLDFKNIELRHFETLATEMADAYLLLGDKENHKRWIILASIAELESGFRDYTSLGRLAELMFEQGDVERAYKYISLSVEDAIKCNARCRTFDLQGLFPIINHTHDKIMSDYVKKTNSRLTIISVLALILIVVVILLYLQIRRNRIAHSKLFETNQELNKLNTKLNDMNLNMQSALEKGNKYSNLKTDYIRHYMSLALSYIEKTESMRNSLTKLSKNGNIHDIPKLLDSHGFSEKDLIDFYSDFDSAFLNLYPNFVDEFNSLIQPQFRIYPKSGEKLNTELRVFALIRLGITDSSKIAKFLRCSVNTVYNYRVKMRNRAAGSRDDFDKNVINTQAILS